MRGVLDSLLEGFAEKHQPDEWEGRFEAGDKVRVSVKGGKSIVGKVLRPSSSKPGHVIVRPDGGVPHVEAPAGDVRLDTPGQHAAAARRAAQAALRNPPMLPRKDQPPGAPAGPPAPGKQQNAALAKVREASIGVLVEAFAAPPGPTPQQSLAAAPAQIAAAKAAVRAGWSAAKHPRAAGGKFGYTTGGKRAKRGAASTSRTLGVGSSGALVKSIQRQLGLPQSGSYDRNTSQAVMRFQQQHGLSVDGVVGAQTIAALRGNVNARSVAPGPIGSKAATIKAHPLAGRARSGRTTSVPTRSRHARPSGRSTRPQTTLRTKGSGKRLASPSNAAKAPVQFTSGANALGGTVV